MSTQTKSSRAPSSSSAISVVKVSRSALRSSSSPRPGSWIVDLAARERLDLLRQDVAGDHPVAELGEAGGGDEADPADPDDADRLLLCAHRFALPLLRFWFGTFTSAERAIPIIWSLVKVLSRSLATQ